jgi:hypothetical protein
LSSGHDAAGTTADDEYLIMCFHGVALCVGWGSKVEKPLPMSCNPGYF